MQLEEGMILNGTVSGITGFGAFVDLPDGKSGMVHISEVSATYVNDINEHLKVGQEVKVKVLSMDQNGKISLSIRRAEAPPAKKKPVQSTQRISKSTPTRVSPGAYEWSAPSTPSENTSFEDMMSRFKQSSDDRMSALKKNDSYPRRPRRSSKPTK